MKAGRFLIACFLVLTALPIVGGCTASVLGGSNPQQEQQTMAQTNYGAADMLIQQSKSLIGPDTSVQIGMLSDMDHPSETTALSRIITGQVGARFVQLGYNVSAAPGGMDNMGMAPGAGYGYDGGARHGNSIAGPVAITGQYALARQSVLINLRLTEPQTGRVLAAYDYSLPLNGDTRELARTAADKNSFFGF